MTCKNVSHCLLVLARNKLLQETHAFHIFQLKEKILQSFSVLMWGITRTKPMQNTGKKCKVCENTKALVLLHACFHQLPSKLRGVSKARVSVLFEDLTCRLSASAYGNHLWHFLLTSYTYSHSVGFLLKVTLDCNGNDVILLCAADTIMRTESA